MIVEFAPEHVRAMRLQPMQDHSPELLTDDYLAALGTAGPAGTLIADGRPVASAGAVEGPDGSVLWAFLDAAAGRYMVAIVRAGRRLMDVASRPVIATTDVGFEAGERLLEMIGMTRVDEPPEVGPDGRPQITYVRRT